MCFYSRLAIWCCGVGLFVVPLWAAEETREKGQREVGNSGGKAPVKDEIDWDRARKLHAAAQRGEKLSAEDQAYYDRARAALREGRGPGAAPGGRANFKPFDTSKLVPLTELGTEKYKGETGGLYGEGKNEPPKEHLAAAKAATETIQPLGADGKPATDGKIALLTIGMSNTTQESQRFIELARSEGKKADNVVIVDGAQGGQAAEQWLDPKRPARGGAGSTWDIADQRLKSAGVTPEQVQVVWIKQALIQQGQFGEFPKHSDRLAADLVKIVQLAKERYPNLRVAYLSSRIYGGYAKGPLNPEPYAYEGAFSVRKVIQSQIAGDKELNYNPAKGDVKAPVVLWGPYLWGNGEKPRQSDGLVWSPDDLGNDGTHPSNSGRLKVAKMLHEFFTTDELAKTWFAD